MALKIANLATADYITESWVDAVTYGYNSGPLADRPTAGATYTGMSYFDTDNFRLWLCDGTGWIIMREQANTYTPTWTNMAAGYNTTVPTQSWYQRSAGFCDFGATITCNGVCSGSVTFSLPVATTALPRYVFAVQFISSGVNNYRGLSGDCGSGATTCPVYSISGAGAGGTLEPAAALNATTPFTWKANDVIQVIGRYRMNSAYS